MKFLPIVQNLSGKASKTQGNFRKTQGADFAEVFAQRISQKSGKNVNAGIDARVKSAAVDGLNLSRDDVLGLLQELSESGISPDRLNRLNGLLNSDEPVTPKSLAEALRHPELYADLSENLDAGLLVSDAELQEIYAFFAKLGFNNEEASLAVAKLQEGGDVEVWTAISQRLNEMDRNGAGPIEVSGREINTLAKLFRLDGNQREILGKLFSGETQQVSAQTLKKALSTIANEMAQRNASDQNLESALEASLEKIRQAALDRQKIEQAADNRGSGESLRKQTLYKDSATANTDGLAPAPAKDAKEYQPAYAKELVENLREEAQSKTQHQHTAQQAKADPEQEAGEQPNFEHRQPGGKQANSQTLAERGADTRGADKQTAPAAGADNLNTRADFAAQMNQNQTFQPQAASAQARPAHNFSQQVLQQVETGMMRSLQDGTKQLTIQLTPEDLGTVTVLLSVKNKEVSAILRPDNPESVQAIEDQLHKLRLVMEQQGLKVERLEVRPQLQDSTANNQSWQGFDQHNQGRQMQQRSQEEQLSQRLRSRSLVEINATETLDSMPPVIREQSMGLDVMA